MLGACLSTSLSLLVFCEHKIAVPNPQVCSKQASFPLEAGRNSVEEYAAPKCSLLRRRRVVVEGRKEVVLQRGNASF